MCLQIYVCIYMLERLYVAIPTKTADGELCNLPKYVKQGNSNRKLLRC